MRFSFDVSWRLCIFLAVNRSQTVTNQVLMDLQQFWRQNHHIWLKNDPKWPKVVWLCEALWGPRRGPKIRKIQSISLRLPAGQIASYLFHTSAYGPEIAERSLTIRVFCLFFLLSWLCEALWGPPRGPKIRKIQSISLRLPAVKIAFNLFHTSSYGPKIAERSLIIRVFCSFFC